MKVSFYDIIKIAPIENLKLSIEYDLVHLIIKSETELHRFSGKDSFVTELKNKPYAFDKNEVYEDYRYLSKLLYSLKNNIVNYDRYVRSKHLYPNLKFTYQKSWDDNNGGNLTGAEFKKLDGLILPIEHKIWRKIYPPNHVNDNCSITNTDEKCNRKFIFSIPKAKGAFNFDFIEFYEKHKGILKPDDPYIRSKNVITVNLCDGPGGIDDLFSQALNEVYKEYSENLRDK